MKKSSTAPVYLHIGLPKTGTTSIQGWLWRDRQHVAQQGVLYPGGHPGAQWHAAVDLQGGGFAGHDMPEAEGALDRVLGQIHRWDGPAVFSHELLAQAPSSRVTVLLDELAPRPVYVIVTLRDLSKVVSASWQERAKNWMVERWEDFVAEVAEGPAGGSDFWRLQDAPTILRRWCDLVGPDMMYVITVGSSAETGTGSLTDRFADLVGLTPPTPQTQAPRRNESLDAAQVRLLQLVNTAARGQMSWTQYHRLVKGKVVRDQLAGRGGDRVMLDESARPWVEAHTAATVRCVRELGCHVVGDLDDLTPQGISAAPQPSPEQTPPARIAELGARLVVDLSLAQESEAADLRRRVRRQGRRIEELQADLEEARLPRRERFKRSVVRRAERTPVSRLVLRVWRLRHRLRRR